MINHFQYDKLFDDLIVVPDEKDLNTYILKNNTDESCAIVIGTIKYNENNFYVTFKNYVDLEAEYLKGIAEYMEGLEYIPVPESDNNMPAGIPAMSQPGPIGSMENMDPSMLMSMFGGMMGGGGMPPIEGDTMEDESAAGKEENKDDKDN